MSTRSLLFLLPLVSLGLTTMADAGERIIRLPGGDPLVCVYYFGHWWDPWKTDDGAILKDLDSLKEMGFNTLCMDHEWSQAIDGNWRWLDREHRLAKEKGMVILPWLSLKSFSDVNGEHRLKLAKEWYGVDIRRGETQDGETGAPLIWDESVLSFGAQYACDYLERYRDGALLHVQWNGKPRPVLCLGVEAAWQGSFDEETNKRFRAWIEKRYKGLDELNRLWATEYKNFDEIDPKDKTVFDYTGHQKSEAKHPQAVEDHVEFRSQTISSSLGAMAERVRERHPDVLFLAEIPYQYGSQHPHAKGYRIGYGANPSSCDYAEMVLFRNTGPLTEKEIQALAQARERTGQRFILTYRTYSDWDIPSDDPRFKKSSDLYATQAAELGDGFGFYSWNEMVDVHVAYSPTPPKETGWTENQAERAIALMGEMARKYRELVGDE